MIPNIVVVTRYFESDGWKDGFPISCLKYDDGTYSSNWKRGPVLREVEVYHGPIPEKLRILPKVDSRFLLGYMTFYSQVLPRGVDPAVAEALRSTCSIRGEKILDAQAYNPKTGEIISTMNLDLRPEIKSYLNMFLKQADWDRIKKWDELGLDNWNSELYEKESV